MNIVTQNGISIISYGDKISINGENVDVPKGMKFSSQTVINGKVYIGGYEFFPKEKKFRRTLKAIWEHLF